MCPNIQAQERESQLLRQCERAEADAKRVAALHDQVAVELRLVQTQISALVEGKQLVCACMLPS